MKMPKYLFAESKSEAPGVQFIVCTEVPFFYAQVWKDVGVEEINAICEKNNAIAAGKPYDYRIGVIILGALHESLFVKDMRSYAKDLARTGREMADFYLEEKIKPNEKYYQRYRERR